MISSWLQFKLEDAAPEAATTSVEATGTVVTNSSGSSSNAAPGSVLIRRPNSLNSAIGGASTGSPVTSPTSGSTITASLRPVSAPFLPHQTTTTEASNDRLSSTTATKNVEENNNDDIGTPLKSTSSLTWINLTRLCFMFQIMTKRTTTGLEEEASPRKESFRDGGDQRDDLRALCT